MTGRRAPSLPFGPLAKLVRAAEAEPKYRHHRNDALTRAWFRGQESGRVTFKAADALAAGLLGLHPSEVWGDAWWVGVA